MSNRRTESQQQESERFLLVRVLMSFYLPEAALSCLPWAPPTFLHAKFDPCHSSLCTIVSSHLRPPASGCNPLRTVTFYTQDQVWAAKEILQWTKAERRGMPCLARLACVSHRVTGLRELGLWQVNFVCGGAFPPVGGEAWCLSHRCQFRKTLSL